MYYYLVYKKDKQTIKEIYNFNTNPVYVETFDISISPEGELLNDDMIFENEVISNIRQILSDNHVLNFSIINNKRKLYHDFEDFISSLS